MSGIGKFVSKLLGRKPAPWITRAPRVRLSPLHDVGFRDSESGAAFDVETLSASGLGLRADSDFMSGAVVNGRLSLGVHSFDVRLQIVRQWEDRVGAKFVEPSAEFLTVMQKHFDAELAALRLVAINREILRETPDGEPYWYRGDNNCDLSFVVRDGRVHSFGLMVFGNYLEWSEGLTLRASAVADRSVSADDGGKRRAPEAALLSSSQAPSAEVLALAARMLAAISELPSEFRSQILRELDRSGAVVEPTTRV